MTTKKTTSPDPWLTPAQMIAELGISKRTWARMRAAAHRPEVRPDARGPEMPPELVRCLAS